MGMGAIPRHGKPSFYDGHTAEILGIVRQRHTTQWSMEVSFFNHHDPLPQARATGTGLTIGPRTPTHHDTLVADKILMSITPTT